MQKEKLKPEQVMEMLRRKGREVTLEQATQVLGFMRKLAKMVVLNYITSKSKNEKYEKL